MVRHSGAPRLNSSVALRGTIMRMAPRMRSGAMPLPPVPTASGSSSPVPNDGWWQVAHEVSRLPLSSLSKNNIWPKATLAGSGVRPGSNV